jgi:N-acetyl-alpha-D-glucosaminyl L-malate synthase BshA
MAKQIVLERGRNIPVITTLHGTDITLVGRDKTYEPVVTFSINQSDAITAVSKNLREETFRSFAITKEIEVVENFVDNTRYNKRPIDAFKKVIAPNNEKILIHASNFRKIKRVEDVIEIFAQVHAQVPSKLLLVGDGPERRHIEELARKLQVQDDVRFLGKQDQVEEIMLVSDLFLLPSEYESFGLAAMEAMAAGAPVISSNAGGLPEINIDGVTGYTAPVGDVATMSQKAIELLSNDALLQQFRKNAKAQALKYDLQNIVPQYEKIYSRFCRMECGN